MLIKFFSMLREGGVKVSITEFLTLLEVMQQRLAGYSVDEFYYLSRACLVKDEALYDRFDRVFGAHFRGIQQLFGDDVAEIPEEWLRKQLERHLTDEEKAQIEALGGWEELMETLRQRLEEQQERHEGGSKWIGTGGTSPFGAYGFNPEGIRIGQDGSRNRSAVKVWDRREFRNLDDSVELGTRNLKVALRRLRKFAREGAADELDLHDTIESTARNGGLLDIRMVPERHNAVKVLLFLYFYFHNCVYEGVWKDNRRRHSERLPTMDLLHKYAADYKVIFVGDATMSPYEIHYPGGSVEHWNEEAGSTWMKRLLDTYPKAIWLNPEPLQRWDYTPSIQMIREIMEDRMFPLTVSGLEEGMRALG
jgi:uncharacterized protein with von Willebrand factor type A (vWA) domain